MRCHLARSAEGGSASHPPPPIPTFPRSCWREAAECLASSDDEVCPSSCPRVPLGCFHSSRPPASLSPSAHSALSTAAAHFTHWAAPGAAGVAGGVSALHGGRGHNRRPCAGRRLLQCRGLALPTLRARAAACTPTAGSPRQQSPVPTQAGTAQFCCPPPLAEEPRHPGLRGAAELWASAAPASVLDGCLPPAAPQGPGRARGTSWVPRGGQLRPDSPSSLGLCQSFAFARALPLPITPPLNVEPPVQWPQGELSDRGAPSWALGSPVRCRDQPQPRGEAASGRQVALPPGFLAAATKQVMGT